MKGVVLAGGTGSRPMPLTKVINKNILAVYDKPLIYYPIETLRDAGIKEILLISGRGHAGQYLDLLGSGKELGVDLTYDIQEEAKGLSHGLAVAEDFADNGPVTMILGDTSLHYRSKLYLALPLYQSFYKHRNHLGKDHRRCLSQHNLFYSSDHRNPLLGVLRNYSLQVQTKSCRD